MKKGTYQALSISALIHVIAIAVLINIAPANKHITQNKEKPKKIKSYIYNIPNKNKSVQELTSQIKETDTKNKPDKKAPKLDKVKPQKEINKTTTNQPAKVLSPIQPKTTDKKAAPNKDKVVKNDEKNKKSNPAPRLSALTQLNNLRSKINADISSIPYSDLTLSTSGSTMLGEQAIVPHSEVPLTPMQKKEKNTTRYADGLSIIKNDNGTCTVEQDLSAVGIEGVTARQGFACGEDPDKKNFREHMKKVFKKLGK